MTDGQVRFSDRPDGSGPPRRLAPRAARARPAVRRRSGFTLVELVAALALIGILTAIVTRAVSGSRRHAYMAVLESDLHSLAIAEEQYFAERGRYFGKRGGGRLRIGPDFHFAPSRDVIIEVRATANGWSGRATHRDLDPARYACAIYSGTIEPYPPADAEGYVICSAKGVKAKKKLKKKKKKPGKKKKGKKKKGKKKGKKNRKKARNAPVAG